MKYTRRDVIIGFVIIAIIIAGALAIRKNRQAKLALNATPAPVSFQNELEDSFKYDIPDDTTTVELKDVAGGNSRGIATEKEILVDANDPQNGYFYQGWLQKGDTLVSVGKLQVAKGGWLLKFDKTMLPDAEKVVVSLETVNDSKLEAKILEGSF